MVDQLVLGGALLPSACSSLRTGWGVAIQRGVVCEIGLNEQLESRYPEAARLDARDLLILPGFVDSHVHTYGVLAHGMPMRAAPTGFEAFLKDVWWPQVEDRLDRQMVLASFRLSCARLICSGVTSVCDVLEAPLIPEGILDVPGRALADLGLRGALSLEVSERHGPSLAQRALRENVRFARVCRAEQRVRAMVSLHTSFTCSQRIIAEAKERAAELGCDVHLHLSESELEPRLCLGRYGTRPVLWYDRFGFWDSSVLASQVVAVNEAEIALLSERGVRVAHMPLSNCEVGGGIAPVPRMLEAGLRPGLGSDGYITDMFQVMRGAFLIHKAAAEDLGVVPASTVLAMATGWGASAIGFRGLGELAPGCPADLVGLSIGFDTPLTVDNAPEQIVLRGGTDSVELVMSEGRVVLSGGELTCVDIERLRHQVREQAARLWRTGTHG